MLRARTEPDLRGALRAMAPGLVDLPLAMSPPLGAPREIFQRGIARVGEEHFVKAAASVLGLSWGKLPVMPMYTSVTILAIKGERVVLRSLADATHLAEAGAG
jgi:hypothetical protein